MTKILFLVNVDWFFISHRLIIAEEAQKRGYEVIVVAEDTGRAKEIEEKGIKFIAVKLSRSGINPYYELITLFNFLKIFIKYKPDIVHLITMKPVIYGSIVAKLLKIKGVVNAVSGLGYNFTESRNNMVSRTMLKLMKFGFKNENVIIIFQNKDDFNELKSLNVIAPANKIFLIKGSGVNLDEFYPTAFPSFDKVKILLPIRMLWDKGVGELNEASKLLKAQYFDKIEFVLAGLIDEQNKSSVPVKYIEQWEEKDYVKWIGYQRNMFDVYSDAHIVVLPSYREGIPKSLIEGCAMGRAIVTTNAVGCKECVDEGVNGLKVPVKDSISLAKSIAYLIDHPNKIIEMGKASRLKAEKEFDVQFVLEKHFDIYSQFIK